MAIQSAPLHITHTKLVVRVLEDVLRSESFASYGDLMEAVKVRCAQLRIAYDSTIVGEAIDRLELGGRRRLIAQSSPVTRPHPEPPLKPSEAPDISRDQATAMLAAIRRRVGASGPLVKKIPAPPWIGQRTRDRQQALEMVLDEIQTTQRRCAVLAAHGVVVKALR